MQLFGLHLIYCKHISFWDLRLPKSNVAKLKHYVKFLSQTVACEERISMVSYLL